MPDGTRIAALFRNHKLQHPSGSTCLEAGDILCVVGHEHDLPALGKLFSEAPERGKDLRFFGDFVLEGDAELSAVAALYGLSLEGLNPRWSLSEFISRQLNGNPVVGDSVEWSGLTWTVALTERNFIAKIGVRLPAGQKGPMLFL